jgi:hypothetical protein
MVAGAVSLPVSRDVSQTDADPRCPECGGAIGATAAYCMHCSADLTAELERADADDDGSWDAGASTAGDGARSDDGSLLDPSSHVDDALTAAVGLAGGLVVGGVGTVVLLVLTDSGLGVWVGVLAWLLATRHLVTRRTALEAVARTAYGVAGALLFVPFVAFAPSAADTGLVTRVVVFATMLGALAIPAAVVAGVGVLLSRYAGDAGSSS